MQSKLGVANNRQNKFLLLSEVAKLNSEKNKNNSLAGNRNNGTKKKDGFNYHYDLNDGVSRFHYYNCDFNFYRRGEHIKGEFITPEDVDAQTIIDDFNNAYPNLQSQIKLSNTSINGSINSEIDETVLQGGTGDCWILSAMNSLNSSEIGKSIIKNAITRNNDNTTTVNFEGIGVSYTITDGELAKYDTDNILDDEYSNGDNDMLIMELAVEKLWNDINGGKVNLNTNNEDLLYAGYGSGIDDGGLPMQLIYYLTGIESQEYYNNDLSKSLSQNKIYSILQEAYQNSSEVLTFGIYYGAHSAKLTNGSTYTLDVGNGGHALSITSVDQNTVTFVNPWDSSVSYTISWSEFAKLGVGYISSADLSDVAIDLNPEEVEDNIEIEANEDIIIEDTDEVVEDIEVVEDYRIPEIEENYEINNDNEYSTDILQIYDFIIKIKEYINSLFDLIISEFSFAQYDYAPETETRGHRHRHKRHRF